MGPTPFGGRIAASIARDRRAWHTELLKLLEPDERHGSVQLFGKLVSASGARGAVPREAHRVSTMDEQHLLLWFDAATGDALNDRCGARERARFEPVAIGKVGSMANNGSSRGAMVDIGEAALTGWRGSVGRVVAKPIARRTRFDVQQIEAVLGLLFLAYTVYRLGRPLIDAARRRS